MATEELRRSWKRTLGYLLDARAHLSEAAEGICASDISMFVEFVENNRYRRTIALDGAIGSFEIAHDHEHNCLVATIRLPKLRSLLSVVWLRPELEEDARSMRKRR